MYLINLPKQDLKWLQKALDKKGIREFSKLILVKNGYAYATNGHVAYRIETIEGQDGLYSYEGIKINDDVRHPLTNPDRIFNDDCRFYHNISLQQANLNVLFLNEVYGINKKYFYDALDKTKQAGWLANGEGTKIKIAYGNRVAIIMGCKL